MDAPKVGRSYVAIRREEGGSDFKTFFPADAGVPPIISWCESEGYKVLGHTVKETPDDTKHIAIVTVTVQPKS